MEFWIRFFKIDLEQCFYSIAKDSLYPKVFWIIYPYEKQNRFQKT